MGFCVYCTSPMEERRCQLRVIRLTAWLSSETAFVVKRKCCSLSMSIADCQSLLQYTVVKIRGRREEGTGLVAVDNYAPTTRWLTDKNRITCFRGGLGGRHDECTKALLEDESMKTQLPASARSSLRMGTVLSLHW